MATAKMLPHSLEAEQSVLGSVLIDKEAPIGIFSNLKAEDFYSEAHKRIFEVALNIYLKNTPVDFVTLTDALVKKGILESVGGLDYVTSLTTVVPSAANFKHYADIVKNHSIKRQLISAAQAIINISFEAESDADALSFAEKSVFDISRLQETTSLTEIALAVDEAIAHFDKVYRDPNALKGLKTDFVKLDALTNGLQKGDLVLLAARPGVGKTSLGMNIVANAALNHGAKAAVFSLEMPKRQLAQRILCSVAYVNMADALRGEIKPDDWKRLFIAQKKLADAQIYLDDSSLTNPVEILSKCRRLKKEHGLDLIMIDYLQLMSAGGRSKENRQQEISEISRNLKILAKELDVPVLLLSQLSRATESRKDHRPVLSDLRESGAIEQDADIVLFLYKAENYADSEVTESNRGIVELIVAKHRNGATTGDRPILLKWIGEITTFNNLESDANKNSLEAGAPQKRVSKTGDMPDDADAPPDIQKVDIAAAEDIFDDI